MQYRVGTCASCNATFKVPATFPADKAKCKSCADGVVEIGPPVDEPEPKKESFEEYVPSGKSGKSGPSMMEKLRAQRAEDAAAAAPPVPSRKPAEAKSEKAKEDKPKRAGSGKKGVRTRRGSGKPARSGGRRSGAVADDGEDHGGGTSGRWQPRKKKSPLPMLGSFAGALIAVFLVWKFVIAPNATEETPVDNTVAEAGENSDSTTDSTQTSDDPDEGAADETAEDLPVETGPDETAADTTTTDDTPEETAKPERKYDPSSVDLSDLEVFGPQEGTTPEEWSDIQQLTATAIDPDAGAAGSRAVKKIIETYGPKAFGSIVNRMATLDYSTEQGFRDGDVLQRALMDISNGKNAGWAYSTSDKDHVFNKKVVVLLHKVWSRARTDEAYWLNYSKQDKAAEDKEDAAEMSDDDLDALDDIDF